MTVLVILGVCGLAESSARAQSTSQAALEDSPAARLAQEGADAYENGRYEEAADKLQKAYPELRVPTVGLYLARSLDKLGHLVESLAVYDEVRRLSPRIGQRAVQEQAQVDAAKEAELLAPRIPRLALRFDGAAAEQVQVTIDGGSVSKAENQKPHPVNPGRHVIEARCEGREPSTQTVEVGEAEIREVRLRMLPLVTSSIPRRLAQVVPPAPLRPQSEEPSRTFDLWHPAPLTALGVGAVGVLVGGITGVLALSKQSDLDDRGCSNQHCPRALASDVDELNSLRTASTVSFVVGGVGLAAGAALILVPLPGADDRVVAAWVGPATVGMKGAF